MSQLSEPVLDVRPIMDWNWIGTVYVCGPMSGLIDCNVASFNFIHRLLTAHPDKPVIMNPATLNQKAAYGELIKQSFSMLLNSTILLALPRWHQSHGASNEVMTANLIGLKLRFVHPAYLSNVMVLEPDYKYLERPL